MPKLLAPKLSTQPLLGVGDQVRQGGGADTGMYQNNRGVKCTTTLPLPGLGRHQQNSLRSKTAPRDNAKLRLNTKYCTSSAPQLNTTGIFVFNFFLCKAAIIFLKIFPCLQKRHRAMCAHNRGAFATAQGKATHLQESDTSRTLKTSARKRHRLVFTTIIDLFTNSVRCGAGSISRFRGSRWSGRGLCEGSLIHPCAQQSRGLPSTNATIETDEGARRRLHGTVYLFDAVATVGFRNFSTNGRAGATKWRRLCGGWGGAPTPASAHLPLHDGRVAAARAQQVRVVV